MSAAADMTAATPALAPALQYLAANPAVKVKVVAAKFKVNDKDLWAWLGQFNMSRRELSTTRIDAVLQSCKVRPAAAPAPLVKATAERVKGREPVRPATTPAAPDAPWLKRRWRGDGYVNWRKELLALAANPAMSLRAICGTAQRALAFAAFKANWIGTGPQSAERIKAFVAFADGQDSGAAKPAPAKVNTLREVNAQPTKSRARLTEDSADTTWAELETGRQVDFDFRYSGAGVKAPCLTSTADFVRSRPALMAGMRVRIFWSGEKQRLKLAFGGEHGLRLRLEKHQMMKLTSVGLAKLLGKEPRWFKQESADVEAERKYAEITFATVGGAS